MFGNDDNHKTKMLGQMATEAYHSCRANRVEAEKKLQEYLKQDRRFDGYDHERLAKRVSECGERGSRLDLTDPYLRKGGQPRPEVRRGSGWG